MMTTKGGAEMKNAKLEAFLQATYDTGYVARSFEDGKPCMTEAEQRELIAKRNALRQELDALLEAQQ